ncbi:Callose synthase [Artemisia annua]|uniref:Callose synthase n=1 Tax=Artemisia annua TaxID=35608 RepID=A0A2U1P924_ARTAN|nr:Callose synthase [Artemisia annua]
MASTSGTKDAVGPPRSLSRRSMTRSSTMFDPNTDQIDSELVPSSLSSIAPILRVANEIEKDNPRVAYLECLDVYYDD